MKGGHWLDGGGTVEAIAPNELEQHRRKRTDLETRLFQKQERKIADKRQSICHLVERVWS
jgi:hypothetical protein